jgi:hypothetical protein
MAKFAGLCGPVRLDFENSTAWMPSPSNLVRSSGQAPLRRTSQRKTRFLWSPLAYIRDRLVAEETYVYLACHSLNSTDRYRERFHGMGKTLVMKQSIRGWSAPVPFHTAWHPFVINLTRQCYALALRIPPNTFSFVPSSTNVHLKGLFIHIPLIPYAFESRLPGFSHLYDMKEYYSRIVR